MSLFGKKQPVEQPLPGGKDVIRAAIAVRVRRMDNLKLLSRELQIPTDGLTDFAAGKDNMNDEALAIIATFLWPTTSYNGATDRLFSTNKPPETFAPGGHPQAFQGPRTGHYAPVTAQASGVNPDPKLSIGHNDITPKYQHPKGWSFAE
jgi:hypothetical protein